MLGHAIPLDTLQLLHKDSVSLNRFVAQHFYSCRLKIKLSEQRTEHAGLKVNRSAPQLLPQPHTEEESSVMDFPLISSCC